MNTEFLLSNSPHMRSFSEWERLLYIEGNPLAKALVQLDDPSRDLEVEPINSFIQNRDLAWSKQLQEMQQTAKQEIATIKDIDFAEKVIKEIEANLTPPKQGASLKALISEHVAKINKDRNAEKK